MSAKVCSCSQSGGYFLSEKSKSFGFKNFQRESTRLPEATMLYADSGICQVIHCSSYLAKADAAVVWRDLPVDEDAEAVGFEAVLR